jgi:hypothetical protein
MKIPSGTTATKVRCMSCQFVFRIDQGAEADREGLSRSPGRARRVDNDYDDRDEEETERDDPPARSPRRTRRVDNDYDEDDDAISDRPARRRKAATGSRRIDDDYDEDEYEDRGRPTQRELEKLKKKCGKTPMVAGWFMIAVSFFTAGNIGFNLYRLNIEEAKRQARGLDEGVGVYFTTVISGALFGMLLLLVGLGGSRLIMLASRVLVITAIVFCAILSVMLAWGAYGAFTTSLQPWRVADPSSVIATMVWNLLSAALNLAAGVLAIRALAQPEVQRYYQARLMELLSGSK